MERLSYKTYAVTHKLTWNMTLRKELCCEDSEAESSDEMWQLGHYLIVLTFIQKTYYW